MKLSTFFAITACALATATLATPARAVPVVIGDPTIYATLRHLSASGAAYYAPPNPAAELTGPGVIRAETDRGTEVGLASALPIGLYGAEVGWVGSGEYNGQQIRGTRAEVWYEQRYRTTDAADSFTANLFGMFLEAVDADGRNNVDFEASFYLDMWITRYDPEGPAFGTDPVFDETLERYARIGAQITGRAGDWDIIGPHCQRFTCRTTPEFDYVERESRILASLEIADASFDLGRIALPVGTEFTLTQRVTMIASGGRGEALAEARFFDPVRGYGVQVTPGQSGASEPPVDAPEPFAPLLATLAGGLVLVCRQRRTQNKCP